MATNSDVFSRLYKTLHYLFNLLRSSQHHLLRFLHQVAHHILQLWPSSNRKPSSAPRLRPRTLPAIRPRALTAPSSPLTSSPAADSLPTTFTQLQSPLFSLPLEIRRLIYRYTLTSPVTHIVRLGSRLGHVQCRDLDCESPWLHRCWGITVRGSDLYHGPHADFLDEDETQRDKRGLLPLVMACRRVYMEAIPVLYEDITFSMIHLESVILFAETILPQRFNTIRSIQLSWYFYYFVSMRVFQSIGNPPYDTATWKRVWSILANMENLIKLRVDLVWGLLQPLTADEERDMLEPAMKVKRPRMWDLRVDYEGDGFDWEAQGAPFKVTRGAKTRDESNEAYETHDLL